jgi:NADH dehydrogenase
VARLAVLSARETGSGILDALGPETFTFEELVRLMASHIKPGVRLVHVPPSFGIGLGRLIGWTVGDTILTGEELRGLMDGLLTSEQAPNGVVRFSEWLETNRDKLGKRYKSEIKRHFAWK